jgi:hypothetical protein
MTIKEYIEKVKEYADKIIEDFPQIKKDKAIMAYQKFNEYLLRLDKRYHQLLKIEDLKTNLHPDSFSSHNIVLKDIQLEFVDKTESFHQQVYATISAFILLVSHISFKQWPIRKVSAFLKKVSENTSDPVLQEYIETLKESIEFRSKFIDHPQQHILHDWMTYSYINGTCIIYFVRNGSEVYYHSELDPYSKNFIPPVSHETFYVSPPHKDTFKAMIKFTEKMLSEIESNNE